MSLVRLAAATPGTARTRSSTVRADTAGPGGDPAGDAFGVLPSGTLMRSVSTESGSNPGFSAASF